MEPFFHVEDVLELAERYRALGPFVGIALPFIESFLPFLPLVVFVIANAGAYGLLKGFILSWIGTVLGSYAVFLIVRTFGRQRLSRWIEKRERVQQLITWVERNGFGPLFILICFPFTPSALVNIVAGLSRLNRAYYAVILMAGKFVMIFSMSFVGHDLRSLLTEPKRALIVLGLMITLWFVGKRVETYLNAKVEFDLHETRRDE